MWLTRLLRHRDAFEPRLVTGPSPRLDTFSSYSGHLRVMIATATRRACVEARTYARRTAVKSLGTLGRQRGYASAPAPQVGPATPVEKILLDQIRVRRLCHCTGTAHRVDGVRIGERPHIFRYIHADVSLPSQRRILYEPLPPHLRCSRRLRYKPRDKSSVR